MTSQEVQARIEAAWSDVEPPPVGQVVYDESGEHLECAEVAQYYRGKKWQEVTLEGLHSGYRGDEAACLYFMTPAAFCYYLASYMVIALREPQGTFVAEEAAVSALTPTSDPSLQPHQSERFSRLRPAQRDAVRAFLAWVVANRGETWGVLDPRAACEHWRNAG